MSEADIAKQDLHLPAHVNTPEAPVQLPPLLRNGNAHFIFHPQYKPCNPEHDLG